MASERAEMLRTQAVHAIIAALGGCEARTYGSDALDQDAGVHLRHHQNHETFITSDTYWTDLPVPGQSTLNRVHRAVQVTVRVIEEPV